MSDSEVRDDSREVFMGVLFPAVLLTLVVANLWTGKAWVLARRGAPSIIYSISDPWLVAGFVVMELGIAIGFFARYWLANRPRYDQYVVWIQLVGGVVASGGLLCVVVVALFSGVVFP